MTHHRCRTVRAVQGWAAVLVAAVLGACGDAPAAADGVPVAPDGSDVPGLEVEEVLRLGGLEVDEPYLFSTLADVVRDGEGTYYVADRSAVEVRVFDSTGAYLRRFGRKGEGPGELVRVDDLVLGDGRVAMVNRRRGGRIAVFTTGGEPVEDWRNTVSELGQFLPVAYRDGRWLVESIPAPTPLLLEDGDTLEIHHSLHPLLAPPDSVGEELARWVARVWYGSAALLAPDRIPPLFHHRELVVADPRGVLYRSPGFPYRVEVLDTGGSVVRTVGLEVRPVPIGERDYRAYEDRLMQVLDTTTGIPDVAKVVAEPFLKGELRRRWEAPRARERTVVGGLLAAADGSVWVERWDHLTPAETAEDDFFNTESLRPNRWELFDASGAFRGRVVLPRRFRATHATATTLTGVVQDDYDLEYVVTYRVGEGGG